MIGKPEHQKPACITAWLEGLVEQKNRLKTELNFSKNGILGTFNLSNNYDLENCK